MVVGYSTGKQSSRFPITLPLLFKFFNWNVSISVRSSMAMWLEVVALPICFLPYLLFNPAMLPSISLSMLFIYFPYCPLNPTRAWAFSPFVQYLEHISQRIRFFYIWGPSFSKGASSGSPDFAMLKVKKKQILYMPALHRSNKTTGDIRSDFYLGEWNH